jgi:uncharacterized protein
MEPDGAGASCRRCGAPLRSAARFCSRCGAATFDAGPAPAARPAQGPPQDPPPPLDRWVQLRVALQLWVALVLCSGGIGVISNLSGSTSPMLEVAGTIALAFMTLAFAAATPREIGRLLSARALNGHTLWLTAVLVVALLGFIQIYALVLTSVGFEYLRETDSIEQYRWPVWAVFVMGAACPAVFEEIAFRGVIYRRLELVGGPREALVIQAAMFSIIHLLPAVFISHFFIGLALGWLRQRSNSLLPGMLVHGAYNGTLLFLELAT